MAVGSCMNVTCTCRRTYSLGSNGYGHFVFESAAQEQGLRDIRFVPRPDRLDLMIQEQVQQAGLRGRTGAGAGQGPEPRW